MKRLSKIAIGLSCLFALASAPAMAGGEKYRDNCHALTTKLFENAQAQGLCSSAADCKSQFELYAGCGKGAGLTVFSPNPKILAETLSFLAREGSSISGGIPITLKAYHPTRAQIGNKFNWPEPFLTFEIKATKPADPSTR